MRQGTSSAARYTPYVPVQRERPIFETPPCAVRGPQHGRKKSSVAYTAPPIVKKHVSNVNSVERERFVYESSAWDDDEDDLSGRRRGSDDDIFAPAVLGEGSYDANEQQEASDRTGSPMPVKVDDLFKELDTAFPLAERSAVVADQLKAHIQVRDFTAGFDYQQFRRSIASVMVNGSQSVEGKINQLARVVFVQGLMIDQLLGRLASSENTNRCFTRSLRKAFLTDASTVGSVFSKFDLRRLSTMTAVCGDDANHCDVAAAARRFQPNGKVGEALGTAFLLYLVKKAVGDAQLHLFSVADSPLEYIPFTQETREAIQRCFFAVYGVQVDDKMIVTETNTEESRESSVHYMQLLAFYRSKLEAFLHNRRYKFNKAPENHSLAFGSIAPAKAEALRFRKRRGMPLPQDIPNDFN